MVIMHVVGCITQLGEVLLPLGIGSIMLVLLAWIMIRSLKRELEHTIDGQQQLITSLEKEISACKLMEAALRASNIRYQCLFDNSLDAVLLADDEARYVDANPVACELVGYSYDELLKLKVWDITPDPDSIQGQLMWEAFIKQGKMTGEYTILRKDGTKRQLEFRAIAHVQPGLHLSILHDITHHKQAEEVLRRSEERFRRLVESVPGAILLVNEKGEIILVNKRVEELFGYSHSELIEMRIESLLPERHRGINETHRSGFIAHPSVRTMGVGLDLAGRRKDGSEFPVEIGLSYIQIDGGMLALAFVTDITERKQIDKALSESEKRHSIVSGLISDYACAYHYLSDESDDDAQLEWAFGAFEDVSGHSTQEAFHAFQLTTPVHPDDLGIFLHLQHKLHSGQTDISEFRIVNKQGQIRWLSAYGQPEWDIEKKKVTRVYIATQDITERKVAEEALRQSESRLRSMVEMQSAFVMRTDMQGNFTYINQAFFERYRWIYDTKEAFIGVSSLKTNLPDEYNKLYSVVQDCIRKPGQPFQIDLKKPTVDNGIFWTLWEFVGIQDHSGQVTEIQCIGFDITEQRQWQAELAHSLEREREARLHEELFRNTAETLSQMTNFENGLQQAAINLKKLIAYDELVIHQFDQNHFKLILYQNYTDIFKDDVMIDIQFAALVQLAFTLGGSLRLSDVKSMTVLEKLGTLHNQPSDLLVVPLIIRGFAIGLLTSIIYSGLFTSHDMEVIQTFANQISVAMDNAQVLTDLENSYNRLQDAQEKMAHSVRLSAIGELAAGIAHQINNPLMTVIGDSNLLLKQTDPTSLVYSSAEAINRAATRAGEVVHRLLDLSRDRKLEMTAVNINRSLEHAVELVRFQIEPHFAEIHMTLAPHLPNVMASDNHLQDIWINLLLNARDALKETRKGIIAVTTNLNVQEGTVEIIIEDNGPGIEPQDLGKIFVPFYTTKPYGTGLGLAICADIVKQHHATISVVSQPGVRTTFAIQLQVLYLNSGIHEE